MTRRSWSLVVVAVAIGAAPVAAQLSFSSTYDDGRTLQLEGVVTHVEWVNPRAYLFVNVRDAAGSVANWAVEIGSALELERAGHRRETLRIGEVVRVDAHPAHGIANRAFARTVTLPRTGQRLFAAAAARPPGAGAVPRWPDGRVRLGPPPGQRGYWRGRAGALVEVTAKVAMNGDGLLMDLSEADRVAPFRPWAKAVFLHRQRTRLVDDPLGRCLPPGGPRQFLSANGFQFVEQREIDRLLVLHGGGNRNWRVIHTDGRPVGQPADAVPGYYGHSVGRWDTDTLVVESVGYNERFWLSSAGLPHTEALRLVERFTRTGLHTLRYEVTVDDPRTYTRPWTGGWTFEWVAGEDLEEYFCEESVDARVTR
jgi:hypothetical protein